MARPRAKVCLLGEGRVGKTSILVRFCRGEFDDRQISTTSASYLDKTVTVNSQPVKLSIWDTAGQERFHALGPLYYRDADAALLVYDITDQQSFERVKHWVKELRKIVGNSITLCLAGNKCDLERSRNVDKDEALAYAKSVGASHFLTSAKTNRGLEAAFTDIVTRLLAKTAASPSGGAGGAAGSATGTRPGGGRRSVLKIAEDEPPKKSSCC